MNSGRLIGVHLELARLTFARSSIEPEEAKRAERGLATARVLFAAAAFAAISIDPTEPTRYYFLAYTLLLTYVLYSVGVLIALTLPKSPVEFPRVGLCAADLIWGFYLDFLHAGSEQPILPFFYFRAGSVSVPLGILGNGRYRSNCRFAQCRSGSRRDRRIQQERIHRKRL